VAPHFRRHSKRILSPSKAKGNAASRREAGDAGFLESNRVYRAYRIRCKLLILYNNPPGKAMKVRERTSLIPAAA
jgi:hypothetical protein